MEIALNFMGPGVTKTMTRINENGNVVGTIIVNREGFPETTTLDSLTAATYSTHMRNLSHHATNALKEIIEGCGRRDAREYEVNNLVLRCSNATVIEFEDVTDELMVLRLVSKKTEAVVSPDREFHLIVVMRRS